MGVTTTAVLRRQGFPMAGLFDKSCELHRLEIHRLSIRLGEEPLGMPRSYSLVLVACLSFLSQVAAASFADIRHLLMTSWLLGLAYGSVFFLFPTVCLEWFWMPHFSENWGYHGVLLSIP